MKQKLIYFACIIIGMLSLLYLMNKTSYQVQEANSTLSTSLSPHVWMSVFFLLFGILIEWKALFNLINAKINIRWILFIIAVVLAVITFIPSFYWIYWFGLGSPFYIDVLWNPETRALLTALSGILIIRSLTGKV